MEHLQALSNAVEAPASPQQGHSEQAQDLAEPDGDAIPMTSLSAQVGQLQAQLQASAQSREASSGLLEAVQLSSWPLQRALADAEAEQAQHRSAAEAACQRAQQSQQTLEAELDSTRQQLATAQANLQSAQQRCLELGAAAAASDERHSVLDLELQGACSQLALAQQAKQALKAEVAKLQKQLVAQEQAHATATTGLQAQLSIAQAECSATEQAAGMQAALANSSRQLSSLCEAVQIKLGQHQALAEQAVQAVPEAVPPSANAAEPAVSANLQINQLLAQLAAKEAEMHALQLDTIKLQRTVSDLVRVGYICCLMELSYRPLNYLHGALQEMTAAATEAQLGIERQRAEVLQASLESRLPQAQAAAAGDPSVAEARLAAVQAASLAEQLKNEVSHVLCPAPTITKHRLDFRSSSRKDCADAIAELLLRGCRWLLSSPGSKSWCL